MDVVNEVLANSFISCFSTIGYDENGNRYNINADTAVSCCCRCVKVLKPFVSMTDVVAL